MNEVFFSNEKITFKYANLKFHGYPKSEGIFLSKSNPLTHFKSKFLSLYYLKKKKVIYNQTQDVTKRKLIGQTSWSGSDFDSFRDM